MASDRVTNISEVKPVKIVLVGEINSGKTWLWQTYFCNRKPKDYTQTIFDNHSSTVFYEGKEIPVSLFEACGDEDYSEVRKLIYPGADVIIFCIGIENPGIWTNQGKLSLLEKWSQELKSHCKGIPILVVGTKKDVRDDLDTLMNLSERKLKPLKNKDLSALCKKVKGQEVLECSAVTNDGLQSVFTEAIKLAKSTSTKKLFGKSRK